MNCKNIGKFENEELYLEFKKTYLMFIAKIVEAIEAGDTKAAEQYQLLEDEWKEVEVWYENS